MSATAVNPEAAPATEAPAEDLPATSAAPAEATTATLPEAAEGEQTPPAEPVAEGQEAPPADPEAPREITPARAFLDKSGLITKLEPLRLLNEQMQKEHPQLDDFFPGIESDPAQLKRFLGFANCGWFNSRIEADSPYMAYTRFGTEGFYKICLATFCAEAIGELPTRFRIWRHLEMVATTGELLARELAPRFIEDSFAAGLLHDAAVAPLERELPEYVYLLECVLCTDPVVTALENKTHGLDHAQVVAELAQAMSFKDYIVEALAHHHNESMSAVAPGNARAVLGLLLATKRAIQVHRGQKKAAFETGTEKVLLSEIAAALGVTSGRVLHSIGEVVELLNIRQG